MALRCISNGGRFAPAGLPSTASITSRSLSGTQISRKSKAGSAAQIATYQP
jgi:hypothetical protein